MFLRAVRLCLAGGAGGADVGRWLVMPTFKVYVKFHVEAFDAEEAAEKFDVLTDEMIDVWVDDDELEDV